MQVSGPVQGASTIPRRSRLNALLAIVAIVVIAAVVALMVWVVPLATSGVGAEDAISKAGAGSAVIHDDAGNMPTYAQRAAFYPEKVAPLNAGAGSAVIHDDAGNANRNMGSAPIHDDPWNLKAN
jgi:hypothetical protein